MTLADLPALLSTHAHRVAIGIAAQILSRRRDVLTTPSLFGRESSESEDDLSWLK